MNKKDINKKKKAKFRIPTRIDDDLSIEEELEMIFG